MDVHHAAGIFNKAIYNLVTTTGWDLIKAYDLFLTAVKCYWFEEDSFVDALCGLLKACEESGGRWPKEDVALAFQKVGLLCSKYHK